MGRRSDHSREQIRQMAIEATETILQQEGLAGLSTRKVAKAIGYTVGTLYLAFENLDDLILQVNAKTLDELHDVLVTAVNDCRSAEACIARLAHSYYQFAKTQYPRWSLLYEYQSQTEQSLPDWFEAKIQALFKLVEACLQRFDVAKSETQRRLAAQVLWSGIHGVCVLNLTNRITVVSDEIVPALIDATVNNFIAGYLAAQH